MIPFQPTYLEGLSSRSCAFWLISGVKTFYGFAAQPDTFSLPDAFPGAQRHIGNNQFDLASDLSEMYFTLSASTQARFQEGLSLVLAELDFDRTEHYRLAQEVMSVARRIRAKSILDIIPSLHVRLNMSSTRPDLVQPAQVLRHELLAGAVDLASATRMSQRALVTILKNGRGSDFSIRELSSHLLRLCRSMPPLFETWFAIFSFAILASLRAQDGEAASAQVKEMRADLHRV